MNERVAIVAGLRSPMAKAGTGLKEMPADELGASVLRSLVAKLPEHGIPSEQITDIDEVIIGSVAQPSATTNVARVMALKAGIPQHIPASSVQRVCASGMESITTAATKINAGRGSMYLAGGVESMSTMPLIVNPELARYVSRRRQARSAWQRFRIARSFRQSILKPESGMMHSLTDGYTGELMGHTAENLVREFGISREAQDQYALRSHHLAVAAEDAGVFHDEVTPVPVRPGSTETLSHDTGPRRGQTIEALQALKPYFDPLNGSVTVGNASQVTDGAAAVLLMSESAARERGIKPLGFLREFAYASLEPQRMGLGPVYAISRLMERVSFAMSDIDYIELNEAFAAQVIACEMASDSDEFARTHLGRETRIGLIERDKLNLHGGGISLGHPLGMTGTRIVLHTLMHLRSSGLQTGLATLCVGGGQGAALLLEAE